MSENSFTEVTSTSWFGRIGGAIKGLLFGFVMVVLSVPVLFLNEGNAVKTRKTLDQGAKDVKAVSNEDVDAANEGKLIYFKGDTVSEKDLVDKEFQVSAKAIVLKREVEYYQWVEDSKTETKKKLGGGEEKVTTYTYEKKWVTHPVESSGFKDNSGKYQNPKIVVADEEYRAKLVKVGAFTLSDGLVQQINNLTDYNVQTELEVPKEIGGMMVHRQENGFYIGKTPEVANLGDARVKFQVALPGLVSVVAKQSGKSLSSYKADAGGTIEMLATGDQSAEQMFAAAQKANEIMTWILRGVGMLIMFIGFNLLFRPLSVLADVLPFLGTIVGVGTGIVAFFISLFISLIVISIAWIFYRPVLGVGLLVLAGFAIYLLCKKMGAQKAQMAPVA